MLSLTSPKNADSRIQPLRIISMFEFEQLCYLHESGNRLFFDTLREWSEDSTMSMYPLSEYLRSKRQGYLSGLSAQERTKRLAKFAYRTLTGKVSAPGMSE